MNETKNRNKDLRQRQQRALEIILNNVSLPMITFGKHMKNMNKIFLKALNIKNKI